MADTSELLCDAIHGLLNVMGSDAPPRLWNAAVDKARKALIAAGDCERVEPLQAEAQAPAVTREGVNELLKALGDLSFECFSPIGPPNRPSIETYNRTYEVLAKYRALLPTTTAPAPVDALTEDERANYEAVKARVNDGSGFAVNASLAAAVVRIIDRLLSSPKTVEAQSVPVAQHCSICGEGAVGPCTSQEQAASCWRYKYRGDM